jgi:hypothetical protein
VFTVQASLGANTGPSSPSPPVVPGASVPSSPRGVVAASPSANVVRISWEAVLPGQDGGSPVVFYTVVCYTEASPGQPPLFGGVWPSPNTTAWFTNAPLNVSLVFNVSAANAIGASAMSSGAVVTSSADPPSAPSQVVASVAPLVNCSPSAVGVAVSWQPPTYTGGVGINSSSLLYDLYIALVEFGPSNTSLLATTSSSSFSLCTKAEVAVEFVVSARNSWGLSSILSVPSPAIVPDFGVPEAPIIVSVIQNPVAAGFTVSWYVVKVKLFRVRLSVLCKLRGMTTCDTAVGI